MRALFVLCVAGCTPTLEVGTGLDHFVALSDGDRVALVLGPQGGHHLWAAARGRAVRRDSELQFELRLIEGDQPISTRTDLSDGEEHMGAAMFVPEPDRVRARRCRLSLQVRNFIDAREVVVE